MSITIKSDNPTYNKIGADVLLKFEVRSGQQTYNDTNIRIKASNINEARFKPLVDIKFNGDQPIINSNLHTDFTDRVQAEFTDAVVRVTIKNSLAEDYDRDYECTALRTSFDKQFKSVKLLQASKITSYILINVFLITTVFSLTNGHPKMQTPPINGKNLFHYTGQNLVKL